MHELFHFIWPRLSNSLRHDYQCLLRGELEAGAKGELGESAAVRKTAFLARSNCWKEYACESFCDTAGWLYARVPRFEEFRLARRWKAERLHWFRERFERYWGVRCL